MSTCFCGASSPRDFYSHTFFSPCFVETTITCVFLAPLFVLLLFFSLKFDVRDLFAPKRATLVDPFENERDDYIDNELGDDELEEQFLLKRRVLTELDALEKGFSCPASLSPLQGDSPDLHRIRRILMLVFSGIFSLSMLELFLFYVNHWVMPRYHLALLIAIFASSPTYGLLINFAIKNNILSVLAWIRRVFIGISVWSFVNVVVLLILYPIKGQFIDISKYGAYWNLYTLFFFLVLSVFFGFLHDLLEKCTLNTCVSETKGSISLYDKILFFLPFLWPAGNWKYRMYIVFSLLFIAAGRLVNVMVPVFFKMLVDSLREDNQFPLNLSATAFLGLYVVGKLLQGNVGIISSIQKLFWIPVSQWSTEHIAEKVFSHLHALSHSFHTSRKTGEVIKELDKGITSIGSLLNSVIFSIGPTLIDVAIAVLFFIITFDIWFGLIIVSTMFLFISLTIVITRWRVGFRRQMSSLDALVSGKAVDSLLNFETVKYFNAEQFEIDSYISTLRQYLKADWTCQTSLIVLNTAQNSLISIGALFIGSYLAIQRLEENDQMSVGDLILFLTYIGQLYMPLNYLGTYYRIIQQHYIDMEKIVELLKLPIEIQDAPGACALQIERGEIVFDNVHFNYLEVPTDGTRGQEASGSEIVALQGLSFSVAQGSTVALVGLSGAGKSTILKLLFRFYDVQGLGSIRIDGQDIRNVTLKSLRESIGIVPQDTVLFYDSIAYNIKYAQQDASPYDIKRVASAALLHEELFSQGYQTKVGERGIRLSGGEKQRIAIARTLLKNPKIIVLDEATSSLDSISERAIQLQLEKMCSGRTTLIIAHRLSTITHADKIIVLNAGRIIEEGTHCELLGMPNGFYRSMWHEQHKI